MAHPLEYIITGALMQCSQGTVPMPFKATPRTTKIAGLLAGNASDRIPLVNIPSFVICQKLTQMAGGTPTPCAPAPEMWQDTYPAKVGGADALLFRSCINCPVGQGKIEFLTSGQVPLPPDISQQIKEAKQASEDALKQAELEKNSVGETGLLEGTLPVWGPGRDFVHSFQTGDKAGMALNAGFFIWDAASVVAGVFTFGTATAGMMAGKTGLRAALKAGSRVVLGMAEKKMAALAAKTLLLKEGLPKALKLFAEKFPRVCVKACFPAGTPIAIQNGFKNIEDIQIGDLVWSWNESTGDLALKPVLDTMQRQSDTLLEFRIGAEYLRVTPEHPFWVHESWVKAEAIQAGDGLLRSDGQIVSVAEITAHRNNSVTVYNFEVADWHTYLVGWWMFVVHNACEVLEEIYNLLGKKTLTKTANELLTVAKNFKNVKFTTAGGYTVLLDKQGLTHILGRHHPKFKLDEKSATMFAKNTTVDDLVDTMRKIINKNPDKMEKIMKFQKGNGQIQETIDGIKYQIGFKNGGKIGQFHILE